MSKTDGTAGRLGRPKRRMEAAVKSESTTGRLEEASQIRSVQAGDVQAFGRLVLQYQDRVYNTVWRICRDPEDARDLTQEAFLKAYKAINRFQGGSSFYTWLFRIAVNLALSHRKKTGLRLVVSLDDRHDTTGRSRAISAAERVVDHRSPRQPRAAELGEMRLRLTDALDALDEQHRAVIVLRDIEGLDYRRIADVLNVRVGTVKSRVHRARVALRAEMERPVRRPQHQTDAAR